MEAESALCPSKYLGQQSDLCGPHHSGKINPKTEKSIRQTLNNNRITLIFIGIGLHFHSLLDCIVGFTSVSEILAGCTV